MRFATIAITITALVAASAMATENPQGRDFERKLEARHKHNYNKKGWEVYTNGKLTWYGGGQLSAPACGGKAPSDDDMVVAVNPAGPLKCGDTVHLHNKGKMVEAKVVDHCAGCTKYHIDATKGVFKKLASLDAGTIDDMHFRVMTK